MSEAHLHDMEAWEADVTMEGPAIIPSRRVLAGSFELTNHVAGATGTEIQVDASKAKERVQGGGQPIAAMRMRSQGDEAVGDGRVRVGAVQLRRSATGAQQGISGT